jgi:hypothetical protein
VVRWPPGFLPMRPSAADVPGGDECPDRYVHPSQGQTQWKHVLPFAQSASAVPPPTANMPAATANSIAMALTFFMVIFLLSQSREVSHYVTRGTVVFSKAGAAPFGISA